MHRRKIKYNDVPFVPCNDCVNWESCQEEAYEQGRADMQDFVEKRCDELGIDHVLIFTCNSAD